MRIVLFTGKGGVGKSTLAAATAVSAARSGSRVLVLSTDTAHSLADALDVPPSGEPVLVEPRLWLQHVDTQQRFEQSWATIEAYLRQMLATVGVEPFAAAEMTVLPGAEEVLALLEVRAAAMSDAYDVLVVDCAPSAETLRLLALPEAIGWYLDRILPAQRRAVQAFKPLLTRAAGVPMPDDDVFTAVQRLCADLDDTRRILTAPGASVRLVMTPERVVLAETRRTYSVLRMFGHNVDGVVVNRMFPSGTSDEWRAGWVRAQAEVRDDIADSFVGLPIWEVPYAASEPRGADALSALADVIYAAKAPLPEAASRSLELMGSAEAPVVQMPLPLVDSDAVDLARRGDELIVTVGSYRRFVTLPAGLGQRDVVGARVRDEMLQVRFGEAAGTGRTGEGR